MPPFALRQGLIFHPELAKAWGWYPIVVVWFTHLQYFSICWKIVKNHHYLGFVLNFVYVKKNLLIITLFGGAVCSLGILVWKLYASHSSFWCLTVHLGRGACSLSAVVINSKFDKKYVLVSVDNSISSRKLFKTTERKSKNDASNECFIPF